MRPATFGRLCGRKKFGMVGLRTVALSQLRPQTRHGDCNKGRVLRRREVKGRAVRGTLDAQALIYEIAARGGRVVARWVPRTPKVRRAKVRPLAGLRGLEMNGSEFERENIPTDALSTASASKPAQPARTHDGRPPAEGLYDPSLEKDSCGVGFIANIKGKKSHQIVSDAMNILCNLEHRGAVGADPRAGDGAGILVQIPHAFFARKTKELGFTLPQPGAYAVSALFMPKETAWRKVIKSIIADQIKAEQLTLLGWRDVPTDNCSLGQTVKPTEPD